MLNREQVQRSYDDINLTVKHNMCTSVVDYKIRGGGPCLGLLASLVTKRRPSRSCRTSLHLHGI